MPVTKSYRTPGVYVEEVPSGPRPIQAVGTSTAGFVGVAPDPEARANEAVAINNWSHFERVFVPERDPRSTPLSNAVYGFFDNGGGRCFVVNVGAEGTVTGAGRGRVGLEVLEAVDDISMVLIPGYTGVAEHEAALTHCENLKDRVAILDPPGDIPDIGRLLELETAAADPKKKPAASGEIPRARARRPRRPATGSTRGRATTGRSTSPGSLSSTRSRTPSSTCRRPGTWRVSGRVRTRPAACTRLPRTRSCGARSTSRTA